MRKIRKMFISLLSMCCLLLSMAITSNADIGEKTVSGTVPGTSVTIIGTTYALTGSYITCTTKLSQGLSNSFPVVTAEIRYYYYGEPSGSFTKSKKGLTGGTKAELPISVEQFYAKKCYTCHEVQGDYNYAIYMLTEF